MKKQEEEKRKNSKHQIRNPMLLCEVTRYEAREQIRMTKIQMSETVKTEYEKVDVFLLMADS